ncbi:MAG: FtsX-like permease family protein [Bacteroidota bacterium]
MQLAGGRDFDPAYGADSLSCLINMTAAKRMNLKEPIVGTKLGNNTVIGVVKDFIFNNPTGTVAPMIVFLSKGSMNHFLLRITNDNKWKETMYQVEKVVKKVNPNFPFEFSFIKEEYQKGFQQIKSAAFMANAFGIMAIFISCLGLFGLSAFLAERRSKEVSIRKVLGASVSSLWFLLSKDFLKPVFIAFVLAAPLAGWVMQQIIYTMEYHVQFSGWIYVIAGAVAISVAVLTVSFNGIKAARANPVKNLGAE